MLINSISQIILLCKNPTSPVICILILYFLFVYSYVDTNNGEELYLFSHPIKYCLYQGFEP